MPVRNTRDILSGTGLALLGAGITGYAWVQYDLGTIASMGPGMFPAGVGAVLAILGLVVAIEGLTSAPEEIAFDLRKTGFAFAGLVAFALLLLPFGIAPATVALTMTTWGAQPELKPCAVAILSLALCIIIYALFVLVFGLRLTLVNWPF